MEVADCITIEDRRKMAEARVPRFVEMLQPLCGLEGSDLIEYMNRLENRHLRRKLDWIEANRDKITPRQGERLVDAAVRVLYKMAVQFPDGYMVITEKTDDQVTIETRERCPILDACQFLSLDTRAICKEIFEYPYQAILEAVNPRLQFSRNYELHRPYHDCCTETITLKRR